MPTYIFPGQGSQAIGMGKDLFSQFPKITAEADAILGYSIAALCVDDPHRRLNQTQYTQPALYTVNALSYLNKLHQGGKLPNFVAGHSLGEYNALLAAGVFDFGTGLKLVKKRGELMSQAVGGAMAAVIGLNIDTIRAILKQHHLSDVAIANYNTLMQTVISGKAPDVATAVPLLEKAGALMVIPLNVSGAFHSPYMRSAQEQFELFLKDFHFSPPKFPVIANCTASVYQFPDIGNTLAAQMTRPVRWVETIQHLLSQNEVEFEEIGPGSVLTGLMMRIKNGQ